VEAAETVNVSLSAPTAGATLANPSTALLTIISDDVPDTTPPQIVGTSFLFDTAPQKLTYTFSEDVSASLSAADLYISDTTTYMSYSPTALSYDRLTNTATFSFGAALPKGAYRAVLFPDGVTDPAGNALVAANNVYSFFFLPGDANHDGAVNFDDMVTLAQNYNAGGKTFKTGDFNYDGRADFNDLVILAQNYGSSLTVSVGGSTTAAGPALAPVFAAQTTQTPTVIASTYRPHHSLRGRRTSFSLRRI
jgi:hypothetical protein